jgi:hypothetical protein
MAAEYFDTWTERDVLQLLPEIKDIHAEMQKFKNSNEELVQKGLMEVKDPFALFASQISYIKHSSYLISPRDVY